MSSTLTLKGRSALMYIYLPVEISAREIAAKVTLAEKLAMLGWKVCVFRSDLFDRIGWPDRGIYIGKNVFRSETPCDLTFYHNMKLSGVEIRFLDEEGGLYSGKDKSDWEKRLVARFDPSYFNEDDTVYLWGEWQKSVYENHNCKARLLVTGSPNYAAFHSKYLNNSESIHAKTTGNLKDYILINTRFALPNGILPISELVGETSSISKKISFEHIWKNIVEQGKLQWFFLDLVSQLSIRYPNKKFVIRPHPAEQKSVYKSLCANRDNVILGCNGDARSWIANASLLIHNGCSTAVQAKFAGKKIVSYAPLSDIDHDWVLANSVGCLAKDISAVESYIEMSEFPLLRDNNELDSVIDPKDAFEAIAQDIGRPKNSQKTDFNFYFRLKIKIISLRDRLRSLIRMLVGGEKYSKYDLLFDYSCFSKVPNYLSSTDHSKNLKISKYSDDLYMIERRQDT
jgi:surface carbohydrate biosynthesis protein